MCVLMDPMEDPEDVLRANRSREKQFVFDCTFDGGASQVHPKYLNTARTLNYFFQGIQIWNGQYLNLKLFFF